MNMSMNMNMNMSMSMDMSMNMNIVPFQHSKTVVYVQGPKRAKMQDLRGPADPSPPHF